MLGSLHLDVSILFKGAKIAVQAHGAVEDYVAQSRSLRLQYKKALVTGKALCTLGGTRVLSFHSLVNVHGALAALQSRSSSWKALKLQCLPDILVTILG
jgi:hypothetical protein